MLARLLTELADQATGALFTYSITVVDNDRAQSAREVVESFKKTSPIDIGYFHEPEQNISLARNTAVRNARGDFIALIDDDELPSRHWLPNMFRTLHEYGADGVLGPVKPHFEKTPPRWASKGNLYERESFRTGTVLSDPRYTRTGNALLARHRVQEIGGPFDPRLGRTGGEDSDFFRRAIEKGGVFVWCDEAPVYETIPPARLKRSYFLKRALLRGVVNSGSPDIGIPDILKSVVAFCIYTSTLPVLFLMGQHLFMKYLIKDCDHIGKLLGLCGIKVIKERSF